MRDILRFSFVMFLGISMCSYSSYAMSEDEEYNDEGGSFAQGGEEIDTANEESEVEVVEKDPIVEKEVTKKHVRSIVDSLLKINKHVEPTLKDPKIKKLMKEQNIGKQIDKLRKDISSLEKTLSTHYSAESRQQDSSVTENTFKTKRNSVDKYLKSKSRYGKRRGRSSSKKIHTVKDIQLSRNATNQYLSKIKQGNGGYKTKSYGKHYSHKLIEYKVKCYGADGSCREKKAASASKKLTTKAEYFKGSCCSKKC